MQLHRLMVGPACQRETVLGQITSSHFDKVENHFLGQNVSRISCALLLFATTAVSTNNMNVYSHVFSICSNNSLLVVTWELCKCQLV